MKAHELCAKLTGRVGQVSDDLWDMLIDDGYVEEVETEPDGFDALVRRARRVRSLSGARTPRRPPRKSVGADPASSPLSPEDQRRASALYEYLAKLASADPAVCIFRLKALRGQLFDDRQAREWILSDGVAQFPLEMFLGEGVSPARELGRIVGAFSEEGDGRPFELYTVRFESQGVEWRVRRPMRRPSERTLLAYPDATGSPRQVVVHRDSVLDDLRWVVRELTRRFPCEEYQATWFVLTGAVPPWQPVRRHITRWRDDGFAYQVLTLTVEPWVSAKTVTEAYRSAQRKMLRGRENRPVGAKNLEVFRFCVQQLDEAGRLPSWPILMKRWNETHAHQGYSDARTFARDYGRARDHVAFPDYDEPW